MPPSEIIKFIDGALPRMHLGDRHAGPLWALTRMISELHPSQLPSDPKVRSQLLTALGEIEMTLSVWATGNHSKAVGKMPDGSIAQIAIRTCLESCSDHEIADHTPDLQFIEDQDYRRVLVEDLATVEADLDNQSAKSPTILGGSLIEALLLDALKVVPEQALDAEGAQKSKGEVVQDLNRWDLSGCIPTAAELGIITEETRKVAEHAQGFRNYIHAGREFRMERRCGLDTAHVVYGALLAVIADLEKWHAARKT